MATTDFTGTADLARRRYELAKGRAESNLAQKLGNIGRQYYGLARQQEAGLEGRGILRSGEANRRRVELGAEEKAARLAESQAAEQDIQSAALDYASVLAEIQAKGGATGTTPEPETQRTPAPGAGTTTPGAPATTPPATDQGSQAPSTQCPPGYAWDPNKNACVAVSSLPTIDGRPVMPGDTPSETRGVPPTIVPAPSPFPVTRPVVGGVNEIGSGGREIGVAPRPTASIATPAPAGQLTIGGVTAPASQWNAAFAALAAAAARNTGTTTSTGTVNPRLR